MNWARWVPQDHVLPNLLEDVVLGSQVLRIVLAHQGHAW